MKKVSIIIPVYNGEKFIKRLLSNVYSQTYGDIELIVVNDGSKDSSYKLLEECSYKAPSNVVTRIIDKPNGGISDSRNRGLGVAEGEYIVFIDQDDRIKTNYISTLVSEIEKEDYDILISGYSLVDNDSKVIDRWVLNPKKEYSKYRIIAPWARIFRKDIIDKNHIRFMQTKLNEDLYFNLVYMSYCKKIGVSSYCGYEWTFNRTSESHSKWNVISKDRNPLTVLNQIKKDMNSDHCLNNDCLEYMQIKHIIWYLFYVAKSANKEELFKAYNKMFEWLKDNYPDYYKNSVMRHPIKFGDGLKVSIIVFVSILLHRIRLLYPILRVYSKI